MSSRVFFGDSRSYMNTLGELYQLQYRELKQAQAYTKYI